MEGDLLESGECHPLDRLFVAVKYLGECTSDRMKRHGGEKKGAGAGRSNSMNSTGNRLCNHKSTE